MRGEWFELLMQNSCKHLDYLNMQGGGNTFGSDCPGNRIVTFELWSSKRSHPAALTSGEKMLELGRDWRKREKANASAS